MKPKKSKDLLPIVAQQLQISEHLVKEITEYYWQEVRKSLSSLKHARIHVTNLGDFTIKSWKIDGKIEMLEKFEETNRQKGLQQMTARFKTVETLYDLKTVKKLMDEEKQRKDFIKLHKTKTDESKREHNQNMEEQRSDIGGSD